MLSPIQTHTQDPSAYQKPRRKESFDRVIEIIQTHPLASVLDIGCAAGDFLFQLHSVNPKIQTVGIDKSLALINLAKKRNKGKGNPQFFRLNLVAPKDRLLYRRLLEHHAECITMLGTLHTFHDFVPILTPLLSNAHTKTIIIHSPFNIDPVNVRVFHQDLTAKNKQFLSAYNIFSQETIAQFLKKSRVADFHFEPFVMKKTLTKDRSHPMNNYHMVDQQGVKWLSNGARLLFQEFMLIIHVR